MKKYLSAIIDNLEPYIPGEQPQDKKYIKLNTNENPYPPSSRVIEVIKKTVETDMMLYPDPNCMVLKNAVAKYYTTNLCKLDHENIFVGNGSDEILALSFFSFFKQKLPILYPDITYSFYNSYCNFFTIKAIHVPLTIDFDININDYFQQNNGIIFPNPNAPTGKYLSLQEIKFLLNSNKESVVIIDEAYIDFGGETAISLINNYSNLLVIQTFSKSRSLAGLRVGFAVGNKNLILALEKAKNSFNSYPLDRLAITGSTEALQDEEYFQQTCKTIIDTRKWTAKKLCEKEFSIIPSKANFLFIKHKKITAKTIYKKLKNKGVLVRYFNKLRIDNHLRVTIGTKDEMRVFIEKIDSIVKNC